MKGLNSGKSTQSYEGKDTKLGKVFHTTRKNISQKKRNIYDFF
jgi:hypothetical protein